MKKTAIILLSFLWLMPVVFAQKAKKEYVNYSLEKVKKKDARMYRMVTQNPDKTWRAEYHKILDNELTMVIDYKTDALETKHGLTRSFRNSKPNEDQEYVNGVRHGVHRKYSSSGEVLTEGYYQQDLKNGKWKVFRSDGKPESVSVYYNGGFIACTKFWNQEGTLMFEGQTKDEKKDGEWTYYFRSGKKKQITHFSNGSKNGLNQKWFENGTMKVEQSYQKGKLSGSSKKWTETGVLLQEGTYVDGQKSGIWSSYDKDGTLAKKMDYGQRPAVVVYISEKQKQAEAESTEIEEVVEFEEVVEDSEETIFMIVEESAEPVGGMVEFRKHLSTYLLTNYPERARRAGVTGRVYVNFVIEKDGTPSTFKIIKGIGAGCDQVAINAIKSYGKWRPAIQRGKFVRQYFNLPIKFGMK